jgi:all-trans-retinol 13,14-reductase
MAENKHTSLKIPGVLYILISYIPWMVYWVMSGMGNSSGIAIALAISVILIIPQILHKNFNLMDLSSIIYFSVASLSTYLFRINAFIENSGSLGYSVLFIMALFSLLIKQPFTFQVAKKDFPEVYWKDKSFLLINNIITAFWMLIFFANALIYYFVQYPTTVILTNIFIAFGTAFSIIFPMKAPAYYVSQALKRHEWQIDVTPQTSKGSDEFDVIIVGSGIAGLTCAALLSKRDYKVLVLEQHFQVGGYCSSFERKGFVFNTGVEDISGLWEKGPLTYLLRELGLPKEDLFVRNSTIYLYKGMEIRADDLEELTQILANMFPLEEQHLLAFFDDAQKAYAECYQDGDKYGTPLPAELIAKVLGSTELVNYPRNHPHFYDWMNKTYQQKLDEYFENDDLKALLCALLGYVGAEPDKTNASSALTACVAYYLHGGYFPKGGAQNFANALRDFVETHGGKVLTNHKVDKILVENGKAIGVRAGQEIFKTSIVVANANAKTTFLELVGKDNLDKAFMENIQTLKMSPSAFMLFLGVDMDLSRYPTLIKDLDEGYEIVINSNAAPTLAPALKSSLTIIANAVYQDFPERNTEAYITKKKEQAELLVHQAEKSIPELSSHVVFQDAATPKTFERYTLMPEGALYSFDQSTDVKRPYFKTPIEGLYLASASTFPGGGVEAVVISGFICANDICQWQLNAG